MAERRMFAKTIIDSDAFLELPLTAQALYFHLSMRADDDGFVNNPRRLVRSTGTNDVDMDLLVKKSFVLAFPSGVVCIKHWRIHNYIQRDRYKPTVYREEYATLNIKDNGAYSLPMPADCIQDGYAMDTVCIHGVHKTDTQVRLGKVRDRLTIGSGSNNDQANDVDQPTINHQPPTVEDVREYVHERGDKIDADKFFDVYSANNWRSRRGTPIQDWRAAVRCWERSEHSKPQVNEQAVSSFDTDSFFEAAIARSYGGEKW